jgi:hypothetical protein
MAEDEDARRQKIVDAFVESPAYAFGKVTDDERRWLLEQPLEACLGPNASPNAVLHIVMAHREPPEQV